VFAINFDEEVSGIPKFEPSWRDPNAETAVLSACSTLVSIVDSKMCGKIVQFSHFSVQEYLTSDRIANADHVSCFHIHPKPAHTLLAKSCLSVLFGLDYTMDKAKIKNLPLAEYAAKNWVEHARFKDVSSYIRDGMDLLFDKDKPHFAIWVWVYNMDAYDGEQYFYTDGPEQPDAVPLYYAALCGFRGLVEHLLTAHPQDLNAEGGDWGAPLNAALGEGHLDIALFLLDRGADGENMGKKTGLYSASSSGYADVVRSLIDRGADLNAICEGHVEDPHVELTPLHVAIRNERLDIAILLLERGADTEARGSEDQTALYMASSHGYADVVRSLIDHGADLNAICKDFDEHCWDVKWAPLHVAIDCGRRDIALLLLERGADTETRGSVNQTALFKASSQGYADVVRSLIDRGADLNAICESYDDQHWNGADFVHWTPLHVAIHKKHRDVVILLLERGADMETRNSDDQTALYMASTRECADIVRQLISHGADLNAKCEDWRLWPDEVKLTPLHFASWNGITPILRILLEHGADPNASDNVGKTALHLASPGRRITDVELLLEYGANVDVRDEYGWTPLHEAAHHLNLQGVVALLNRGADPRSQTNDGDTPIQLANRPVCWAPKDQVQIIQLLSLCTRERMWGLGSGD